MNRRALFTGVVAVAGLMIGTADRQSRNFAVWAAEDLPKSSEIIPADREFFEKKIRPVLAERCWQCHGAEAQEGDLRLDSRSAALEGGSRGPAWVAGAPQRSLLISAVNHADTLQMPPKEKLAPALIADLTEWVRRGAPWPGEASPTATAPRRPTALEQTISAEQRSFWAFHPPRQLPTPLPTNPAWCRTGVDPFIDAKLTSASLGPSASADRRVLLRRATYDLTGLPPTTDETVDFLADDAPDAFGRRLDRLLASPRYGERWGRHWLDIARYGDSNGLDENLSFANAYRYRDYVIRAFNLDKPYDQFAREQLAGDALLAEEDREHPTNAEDQAERLTATGFLVIGAKMLAEDDPVKMQMDIVDEQIDTIGKAFLGLTIGCARCHDHKFDPLSMADYYGLAGIFKSTKTMENFSVVARWQERPIATPAELSRRQAQQQEIERRQADINREVARQTELLTDAVRADTARYLLAAARQLHRDDQLQRAKSFGMARQANPAAEVPDGLQIIEAENYLRGNALRTTTGYGEGIGVILNAGPLPNVAEYEVQVASAGIYQLELRYAAAEARPLNLSINGQVVKSDAAGQATGSWNPDRQMWSVEGFFSFRAGLNVIRLERAQPFPHLDKLLIVPAPDAAKLPADGTAGADVAVKPEAPERPLLAAYVQQWATVLKSSRTQADSPLAEWHAYARRLSHDASAPLPASRYITGAPPQTWLELAERYQQVIRETHTAWRTLKGTEAGRDAKVLPDARLESLRALVEGPQGPLAPPKNVEEYFAPATRESLASQRSELKQRQDSLPKFPEVMAVSEGQIADLRIHLRGNHTSLGSEAPRRVPRILSGASPPKFTTSASGRKEFADWLTHPEHPLTSRVFVNRVWHWHFGAGLVRSNDNFGQLGERPTHPELLDWLALRFTQDGWSTKRLHRELMFSATYQQASPQRDDAFRADPENRLWWRFPRRRLEAEAIRDAILAAGGQIDYRMGGTLLATPNRQYVTSTANVNPVVYESTRRSVYLPVVRSALYEVFQAFDFAEPTVLNGQRDSTTVPPQALFMLNSSIVARQSEALARDLLQLEGTEAATAGDRARLQHAYLRTLSREPTATEIARAIAFLAAYELAAGESGPATKPADQATAASPRLRAWQALCRALFASNEFVYVE